jgi:hypothetical protein
MIYIYERNIFNPANFKRILLLSFINPILLNAIPTVKQKIIVKNLNLVGI